MDAIIPQDKKGTGSPGAQAAVGHARTTKRPASTETSGVGVREGRHMAGQDHYGVNVLF
jgi:hypothetical protein